MALPEGFVIDEPKSEAGLPEGFSVVQDEVPPEAEQEKYSSKDAYAEVVRGIGLTARDAVQGVLALPAMGMDAVASMVYAALDAAGVEHKEAYMSQGIKRGLDSIGLPAPEGSVEEFSSAVSQGIAGGSGALKLGQTMAKSSGPVIKRIGETLSKQPVAAIGSGGTGAAAADITRQQGGGPVAQMVAGVAGGAAFPSRFDIPRGGAGIKPTRAAKVETAEEALGATSKATLAQKSGKALDLAKQDVVSHHPRMQATLKSQNTEAARLLSKHLDDIAPEGAVKSAESGRAAAASSISKLKADRRAATGPLYEKAKASRTVANTSSLQKNIKAAIDDVEPGVDPKTGKPIADPIVKTMETFAARVRAARGNIRKLHAAKKWADEALRKTGDNDLGVNTARILRESKDELVDILRKSNDDYDKAYLKHSEMSKPIDALQDNLVGALSDSDNLQLESTLTKIFNSDINEIKALKKVLDAEDPRAFAGMYRTHMQKLFEKASYAATKGEDPAGLTPNAPEEIYKVLFDKTGGYKTLLELAPTKSAKKNLMYLRDVIGSYMTGRKNTSGAAEREIAVREIEGAAGAISHFFSSAVFHPFMTTAAKTSKGIATGQIKGRVEKLVDVLTNPQYDDAMASVRALDPKSAAAARAMEQVLLQSEKDNEDK